MTPPPRGGIPRVLLWVIVGTVVGIVAIAGLYVVGIVVLVNRMSLPGSTRAQQGSVPFTGPQPWSSAGPGSSSWRKYDLREAGFSVELPWRPVAEEKDYTQAERVAVPSYFYYAGNSGQMSYLIYGLRNPGDGDRDSRSVAWGFTHMYSGSPEYKNVSFKERALKVDGVEGLGIQGSFVYVGSRWFVEGVGVDHNGYGIAVAFEAKRQATSREYFDHLVRSFKWSKPSNRQLESQVPFIGPGQPNVLRKRPNGWSTFDLGCVGLEVELPDRIGADYAFYPAEAFGYCKGYVSYSSYDKDSWVRITAFQSYAGAPPTYEQLQEENVAPYRDGDYAKLDFSKKESRFDGKLAAIAFARGVTQGREATTVLGYAYQNGFSYGIQVECADDKEARANFKRIQDSIKFKPAVER